MVYEEGEEGDSIFLVLGGSCESFSQAIVTARMDQGSFFGEAGLIEQHLASQQWDLSKLFEGLDAGKRRRRPTTVVAAANAKLLEVPLAEAERILKPNREAWAMISTKGSLRIHKLHHMKAGADHIYVF
mmetsp:Transcript_20937/g.48385  ORF Transcript_20937/g.48385 Transcript_20937/m.48385 type:complete len:129 (+) Transcript_20937:318-704(+)